MDVRVIQDLNGCQDILVVIRNDEVVEAIHLLPQDLRRLDVRQLGSIFEVTLLALAFHEWGNRVNEVQLFIWPLPPLEFV